MAIVAVLFYHLGVPYVPSGFIGVDVFFVISGYVITKNIRQGVQQGTFGFRRFYLGRLMRLMPALIVTVICTSIAVALMMAPENASDYARSALSALFAFSNYHYLSHVGYFDAAAETKPLLHTWSLSVEWQFYLLWPLAVVGVLAWSSGGGRAVLSLVALALASMVGNLVWSSETATTFYSTPFRVFEFAIGALAVWIEGGTLFRTIPTALLGSGLTMVVVPMLVPGSAGATPLSYGLVPSLGAALVVLTGGLSTLGLLLTNRLALLLGRISYSTYLVHWPIITLYTYLMFRKPLPLEALAIGVASLVTGWFLYSFVELPFWKGRHSSWNGWSRATFIKAGAAALVLLPVLDMARAGWPWRLPVAARSVEPPIYGGEGYEANRVISLGLGQPRFIIVGDSHAQQFAHGLDSSMKREGLGAIALFDHGCMIAPDLTRYGTTINDQKECTEEYQRLRQIMAEYPLPVVMAFNWPGYQTVIGPPGGGPLQFADQAAYWSFVASKLRQIRQDAGERGFAIVGTVPGSGGLAAAADCFLRPMLAQAFCGAVLAKPVELASGYRFNLYLRKESSDIGIDYIDLYPLFCPEARCISSRDGHDLYSDRSHLSKDGSEVAAAEILRYALREH